MIRYRVQCRSGHQFDGWFQSMAAFERQRELSLIGCPECGSTEVEKAPMAPSIVRGKRHAEHARPASAEPAPTPGCPVPSPGTVLDRLRAIRRAVVDNAEHVGPRFAAEVRRIEAGEADARNVYGEATLEEARDLLADGIAVLPLPALPEDHN